MKSKEPLHPGKVLKMIMDDLYSSDTYLTAINIMHNITYIEEDKIQSLINTEIDIDYTMAFQLGSRIKGTDMAFWLKLQSDYDDSCKKLSENDSSSTETEHISSSLDSSNNVESIKSSLLSSVSFLERAIKEILDKSFKTEENEDILFPITTKFIEIKELLYKEISNYNDYVFEQKFFKNGEEDVIRPTSPYDKNVNIKSLVYSTKKWLFNYIFDYIDRDDKNYEHIKRAVEEIGELQNEIIEELKNERFK